MYINVLVNTNDGSYYLGYGYQNKQRWRCNDSTCQDWKNAVWFDEKTDLEKLIRLLYLRFAQVFEVSRMWYEIPVWDE